MRIEFQIDDKKVQWLDELLEWYEVPHVQSLLNVMIDETYSDMKWKERKRNG